MISYSDVEKFIKNALDVRVNNVQGKPLNQIVGELVNAARDNINSVVNAGKDIVYAHVEACKNAVVNHVSWIKDVINGHITAEANSIRHYIVSGASPVIKSKQTGVINSAEVSTNGDGYMIPGLYSRYVDVNISSINPIKSVIFCEAAVDGGGARGRILNSNTIRVYGNSGMGGIQAFVRYLQWEVIEFY